MHSTKQKVDRIFRAWSFALLASIIIDIPAANGAAEIPPVEVPSPFFIGLDGSGLEAVSRSLDREERGISAITDSSDFREKKAMQPLSPQDLPPRKNTLRSYWSSSRDEDYLPTIHSPISTWIEETKQIQVETRLENGGQLALGWLDGRIRQENEIFGDLDFNLKRTGPFVHVDWPFSSALKGSFRLRDERFTDADESGFYTLADSEHLFTGYLALALTKEPYWIKLNHSREREPDPVYDSVNNRSALNIQAKELTGVSAGKQLGRQWEAGLSIYREQYGSARPNQWNTNLQVSHFPSWLAGTRLSAGTGYYTEEKETIVNLAVGREWRFTPRLGTRIEYQLEYSRQESSWLHQGDILLYWNIRQWLNLTIRSQYSKELGGDRDEILSTQASIDLLF